MLSGHDTTITAVLNSMNAYDYWPPEFASTVFWELRRSNAGIYYINLLYKRNSKDTLDALEVNGCTFNCVFDDFKNNLKLVAIDTTKWEEECRSYSTQIKSHLSFLFLLIVLLFAV
ncbi:hypothetical protein NQ314_001570 [Rhamnusium bicolor]|uniref:Uncharacterized protein n=1 Tax=Rhamnusium bicolor TaxID=1586634 RepID=A0AAV8ZTV3_9CUCU|nr:hypothetical protein NQ314_001570 [Rhamnusium bicolor]